ncbi:hypothetical protein Dda_8752 [Drechslerella dactyloides]|uniref:mRNA-capping enzyme subunit beta n=1 Tax=Drechslerella dactyloides TaxID=74499 RepID=A0AAD6NG43_DREDA|nr:hypothetical protein Dda_8752 [Drechslerella dactyloides]
MDLRSIMNDSGGGAAPKQPPGPLPPPPPHQYHLQQSPIQQANSSSPPQVMGPSRQYQYYSQQPQQLPPHNSPPPPQSHHFQNSAGGRPAPPPLQPPKSPFQTSPNVQPQPGQPYHHRKSSGSSSQPGYPFPSPSPRNNSQGQHPFGHHVQSPSPYNTPHPLSAQSGGSPFGGPHPGHPNASQQLTPTSATSYGSPYPNSFPSMSPLGTPGPGYPPSQQQQAQQRSKPSSISHTHTPTTPIQPQPMAGSPIQGGGGFAVSPGGESRVGKVRERMFAERRREKELEDMQPDQRERDGIERGCERDLSVSPKTRLPTYLDERKDGPNRQKEDWATGKATDNGPLNQSLIGQRISSGAPGPPSFPPQSQMPQQRSQPPTPTAGIQTAKLPSPRHPPPSPQRYPPTAYAEKMEIDPRSGSDARGSIGEAQQWSPDGQVKLEKNMNGYDPEVAPPHAHQDQSLTSSRLNMGPPSSIEDPSSHPGSKLPIKEDPHSQMNTLASPSQQKPPQPSPPMKRGSFPAPPRPQPGPIQVPQSSQPPQPGTAASPVGPPRKRPRHDEPPIFARKASRSSSSSPVIQNRRHLQPGPSAMSQQQPLTQNNPPPSPFNSQNSTMSPQSQQPVQAQSLPTQQPQQPPQQLPPQQQLPQQQAPQQQAPQQQLLQQQPQLPQPQQPPPPAVSAKPPPATAPLPSHVLGPWEPCITNIQPYEEITKHICDFLFVHVVDNHEFATDNPDRPQLEIEAKIGILLDRNTGNRLYLPVKTETVLDSDDPNLKVIFKSSMTELQHKRMNEFLNRTFAESQRQAQQGPPPPAPSDYPAIGASRIPLTYKHLRERDSFYEIPDEVKDLIPLSVRRVPNYHQRLKLRVTTDQKTGRTLNKIIKGRIADLNIYSPRTAFDWRISVNMEMPWKGEVERLVPQSGGERNKDRLSYHHLCFSVDLTQVTAAPGGGDARGGGVQPMAPKKEHELEIEIDAKRVRDQGKLIIERKPNGFQDLVRGNVEAALKNVNINIPQIEIPAITIPSVNMDWSAGGPRCPSSSASASMQAPMPAPSSSSGRPTVPTLPRDDEILVDMYTQSVKNTFPLKKKVTIKSVSGSIKAEIVPSPTPSAELVRSLETHSSSGSQQITVATSLGPFLLDSNHSTASGSMKLVYPSDWCGTIELSLIHGCYDVRSDLGDVTVVRDVVEPSTRERSVLALKGNPQEGEEFSTMKVVSKTGSISIRFEKMPPLRDLTSAEVRAEEESRRRASAVPPPSNKEKKEKSGVAVVRPSVSASASVDAPPEQSLPQGESQRQEQQQAQQADLPPSYEQSEEENVRIQVAGRD